jgi:hypothetical protein
MLFRHAWRAAFLLADTSGAFLAMKIHKVAYDR